jgi:hypothetical protein
VQANTGRSARTNPWYERIDQYLERDLTIVEKGDLSVQSKVKAGLTPWYRPDQDAHGSGAAM